jgi:transcriptional regulator with XRE-family HTH domain
MVGNKSQLAIIAASQLRSARAALRWTVEDLASKSGVGARTIKRIEAFEGAPPARSSTLFVLKMTLEAAGIEFIGQPDDRPGVRLSRPSKADVER